MDGEDRMRVSARELMLLLLLMMMMEYKELGRRPSKMSAEWTWITRKAAIEISGKIS